MEIRSDQEEAGFVALFHHRWAVPILAQLLKFGGGTKRITLQKTLGVGRDSLNRTLEFLFHLGLVGENEGYGHPMRPEIVLTPTGKRLAVPSQALFEEVKRLRLEPIAFRKWSLPVMHVVDPGGTRFNRVKTRLPGITPRALTTALKDLQSIQLVRREVAAAYPPTVKYALTRRGTRLAPVLEQVISRVVLH